MLDVIICVCLVLLLLLFFKMVVPELSSVNMFELLPAIGYARMPTPVSSCPQCLPSNGRDRYIISSYSDMRYMLYKIVFRI